MKEYEIRCQYTCTGTVLVTAKNEAAAEELAFCEFEASPGFFISDWEFTTTELGDES